MYKADKCTGRQSNLIVYLLTLIAVQTFPNLAMRRVKLGKIHEEEFGAKLKEYSAEN